MEDYTVEAINYGDNTSKLLFKINNVPFASYYFQVYEDNKSKFKKLVKACKENTNYTFKDVNVIIELKDNKLKLIIRTVDVIKDLEEDEYCYSEILLVPNESLLFAFDNMILRAKN